jgi:hypothetical protein
MPLEGRISVDVGFTDTDSSGGAQSLKRIALVDATSYTTGKVAVLTGTAGTAAVAFSTLGATTYRDASGALVTFSAAERLVFSWSGSSSRLLSETSDDLFKIYSANGQPAATRLNQFVFQPALSAGTGTGTYTIVIYGT